MAYWLLKSEPSVYSWAQLQKDKKTFWDGVRNFQAAANLRAMAVGNEAFFYHSNEERAIVGVARIIAPAVPDPSDETGKFVGVTIAPVRSLLSPVTLAMLKAAPAFKGMALIRQSRLSVSAVSEREWQAVLKLAE